VDRTTSENGYCGSLSGKLRNECLKGEIFYSPTEAKVTVEEWRIHDNTRRSHPPDTARQFRSSSLRHPRSTEQQTCNSLSFVLVQNVGQASDHRVAIGRKAMNVQKCFLRVNILLHHVTRLGGRVEV